MVSFSSLCGDSSGSGELSDEILTKLDTAASFKMQQ